MKSHGATLALALLLVAPSCSHPPEPRQTTGSEIPSPAGAGSGEPNLSVGPDGRFWLTWIEPGALAGQHALRIAQRRPGGEWSAPRLVAEGSDWFVNWADFPSVLALPDGSLAAHWLVKSGEGSYAYDVHVSRSADEAASWSTAVIPHRDGTRSEHGFVSLYPAGGGRLGLVWLDGRKFTAAAGGKPLHGEMTLRHARLDTEGSLTDEVELDGRVCDCCQTAAARVGQQVLVAYRDRSEAEIRDISLVRGSGASWSAPEPFSGDDWRIEGCPVNGPAISAAGSHVALAWFTAPAGTGRVRVRLSHDAGQSFGTPIPVDDGEPLGRVGVVVLEDGGALVSWLEAAGEGAQVRVRRIERDGAARPSISVARTGAVRSSGFPRLARSGDELLVAWTDSASPSRVRTTRLAVP